MTCIVYRDGVLAADSCVTMEDANGYPIHREIKKKINIFTLPGLRRLAIASHGDVGIGDIVDDLVSRQIRNISAARLQRELISVTLNSRINLGRRRELIGDGDYGSIAVIFSRQRAEQVYLIGAAGFTEVCDSDRPIAIGCDAGFALAALDSGASAVDAVLAATRYGPYSSLPIYHVRSSRVRSGFITLLDVYV